MPIVHVRDQNGRDHWGAADAPFITAGLADRTLIIVGSDEPRDPEETGPDETREGGDTDESQTPQNPARLDTGAHLDGPGDGQRDLYPADD